MIKDIQILCHPRSAINLNFTMGLLLNYRMFKIVILGVHAITKQLCNWRIGEDLKYYNHIMLFGLFCFESYALLLANMPLSI